MTDEIEKIKEALSFIAHDGDYPLELREKAMKAAHEINFQAQKRDAEIRKTLKDLEQREAYLKEGEALFYNRRLRKIHGVIGYRAKK